MSQKLSVINFEWIKGTSQFNEDLIKNHNEESYEGYIFLKFMFNILKNYIIYIMTIEKNEKLAANLHDNTECYTHKKFKTNIK